MERISRGDIWTLVPVNHPKPRPALVLSINPINDLCPDILMVPFTGKSGPLRILVEESSQVSGLRQTSYAKCESVGPVHKSRLKEKIGVLSSASLAEVEKGVRRVLGL